MQIASLFASLGFKIEETNLKAFTDLLLAAKKEVKNLQTALNQTDFSKAFRFGTSATAATTKLDLLHKKMDEGVPKINTYAEALHKVAMELFNIRMVGGGGGILPTVPRIPSPGTTGKTTTGLGGLLAYGPKAFLKGIIPMWGAFEVMHQVKEGIKDARELQASERAMQVVAGQQKGSEEFKWITGYAIQRGVDVKESSAAYASILGAISGNKQMAPHAREMFQAFSDIGVALHRPTADMKGVMLGVTEMLGMGKIYTRQLNMIGARRIPTFRADLAKAVAGGDESKLIELMKAGLQTNKGLLGVLQILQTQANQGGALQAYVQGSQAAGIRNRGLLSLFWYDMYKGGLDQKLASLYKNFAPFLLLLEKAKPLFLALVDIANGWIGGLTTGIKEIINLWSGLEASGPLGTGIQMFFKIIMGYLAVTKVAMLRHPLFLLPLIFQDIYTWFTGRGRSVFGMVIMGFWMIFKILDTELQKLEDKWGKDSFIVKLIQAPGKLGAWLGETIPIGSQNGPVPPSQIQDSFAGPTPKPQLPAHINLPTHDPFKDMSHRRLFVEHKPMQMSQSVVINVDASGADAEQVVHEIRKHFKTTTANFNGVR